MSVVGRVREALQRAPESVWRGGDERARIDWLIDLGRDSLDAARLLEGHLDAVRILAEAGLEPAEGALYGIWASRGPDALRMRDALSGTQPFCSGSDLVDRALVYVYERDLLVELDMRAHASTLRFDSASWRTSALEGTHTWSVTFEATPIERVIGERSWYFERPGFWVGALRPAACWAGGAIGIVDAVKVTDDSGAHRLAHRGAMIAAGWTMRAVLHQACAENVEDPERAFSRALAARHVIERGCTEIADRSGRGWGPRPLVFDDALSARIAALAVYIRQCHAERDLESLGRHPSLVPARR